jgi:hypothetical protein
MDQDEAVPAIVTSTSQEMAELPSVQDRSRALMRKIRAEFKTLEQDEARAKRPAELVSDQKYIFRTRPGTVRKLVAVIDHVPFDRGLDEKDEEKLLRSFNRRHKKDMAHAQLLQRVYEELGGQWLVHFIRVPGSVECWFGTDDEDVAALFRSFIAKGVDDWQNVYEQNPQQLLQVGDLYFPDTQDGQLAAFRYMAEINAPEIKRVASLPSPESED